MLKMKTENRYPNRNFMYIFLYKLILQKNFLKSCIKNIRKFGLTTILNKFMKKSEIKNKLGVAAIVKNESDYILEWIEYHRCIGVDIFYIFDNESNDDLKQLLNDYIESGIVIYNFFPGKGVQEKAYVEAALLSKEKVDWLACIDIDEFIQPLGKQNLLTWLNGLNTNVAQVEFGWMIYGSSGIKSKPKGLVIQNYLYHAKDNFIADYKAVVRPEKVLNIEFPHRFSVAGWTIDESKKISISYPYVNYKGAKPSSKRLFRINHYYSKSLEEFEYKSKRGDASVPNRIPRNLKDFELHDRNEVYDDSMLKYVAKIKKQVGKVYAR